MKALRVSPDTRPKISEMRNLGPAMARMLAEVDIDCEADLQSLGSVAAYARLKFRFGRQVSCLALYAMEAALLDFHWQAIDADTKTALLAQLDVLEATQK